MELEILKIWPDWKATKLLGEGSFGKVYEIVRNNFGIEEHCALKIISIPSSPAELQSMRNEGMDDASAIAYYKGLVEEFVQEIALMSKLKGNVNIVGYEDYAVIEHEDSISWDIIIRMELLTALPTYIKDRSFTVNDVIKLAIDVCNALEVCHEQKIIHRDIKPDNIFVSQNGDYKLGDFGVARTIEKTVSGLSKKGTYTYMAPEVYKGETYGTNVDLYSLGIVMYKLLNNNREPFLPPHPELIKYSDKNDALVKRISGEIIPPPVNCNELLSNVILKSISFKPWERYQVPYQMKEDLQLVKNSFDSYIAPSLHMDKNNYTPQKQNNEKTKPKSTLKMIATVLGWIGSLLWFFIFMGIDIVMFFLSFLVIVSMFLLAIGKMEAQRKKISIVMLVLSIITFNIFNIVAAIMYLYGFKYFK